MCKKNTSLVFLCPGEEGGGGGNLHPLFRSSVEALLQNCQKRPTEVYPIPGAYFSHENSSEMRARKLAIVIDHAHNASLCNKNGNVPSVSSECSTVYTLLGVVVSFRIP